MRVMLMAGMFVMGCLVNAPVQAAGLVPDRSVWLTNQTETAQYSQWASRAFRRCMRRKYGPRYFARVPRAQRYFMAQACGG